MQEQIEAVHRMQDYIEANLFGNITLTNLAHVSLFSPWYSYRLFITYVGITPADYIRRLRLSKSALKLRDNPCKIADIAFEMGFCKALNQLVVKLFVYGCRLSTKSKERLNMCKGLRLLLITTV